MKAVLYSYLFDQGNKLVNIIIPNSARKKNGNIIF